MADESQTVRSINWREVFPFTHIFRSFRVAAHPSKLLLALVALAIIWLGGRFLDKLWPIASRAVPDEISIYEQLSATGRQDRFESLRENARKSVEREYKSLLLSLKVADTDEKAASMTEHAQGLGDIKAKILQQRGDAIKEIHDTYTKAVDEAKKLDQKLQDDAIRKLTEARDQRIADTYEFASDTWAQARRIKNAGLFAELFEYQINQTNGIVSAVWRNDWFSQVGVIATLRNFLTVGPIWLVKEHTVFFIIFGLLLMITLAIFGGAICRIAAIHVARDEKISIRQALMFSVGKLLSFTFAPIIPLLIVAGIGLLVTIASLIGNLPGLGSIIVGALLVVALAAGFVMTLILLGTAGGFNLMFPTIAVEGSDSFDAISRSFSYLYARPWRMAFYSAVAVAYGAITYLFVRMFIYMMLTLTHHFVGLGIFIHADNTAPLWPSIWASPSTTGRLLADTNYFTLGAGQSLGAFLVSVWVFLVIGLLGAYAISFYFSSSTIIYYLMRREVDATDMDDVYIEQADDDLAEPTSPSAAPSTAAPAKLEAPPAGAPENNVAAETPPTTPPPAQA